MLLWVVGNLTHLEALRFAAKYDGLCAGACVVWLSRSAVGPLIQCRSAGERALLTNLLLLGSVTH